MLWLGYRQAWLGRGSVCLESLKFLRVMTDVLGILNGNGVGNNATDMYYLLASASSPHFGRADDGARLCVVWAWLGIRSIYESPLLCVVELV